MKTLWHFCSYHGASSNKSLDDVRKDLMESRVVGRSSGCASRAIRWYGQSIGAALSAFKSKKIQKYPAQTGSD
jgi:hypothetical protein